MDENISIKAYFITRILHVIYIHNVFSIHVYEVTLKRISYVTYGAERELLTILKYMSSLEFG